MRELATKVDGCRATKVRSRGTAKIGQKIRRAKIYWNGWQVMKSIF